MYFGQRERRNKKHTWLFDKNDLWMWNESIVELLIKISNKKKLFQNNDLILVVKSSTRWVENNFFCTAREIGKLFFFYSSIQKFRFLWIKSMNIECEGRIFKRRLLSAWTTLLKYFICISYANRNDISRFPKMRRLRSKSKWSRFSVWKSHFKLGISCSDTYINIIIWYILIHISKVPNIWLKHIS